MIKRQPPSAYQAPEAKVRAPRAPRYAHRYALYSFTGDIAGLRRAMRRFHASMALGFEEHDAKRLAELKDMATILVPLCLVLLLVAVSGLGA